MPGRIHANQAEALTFSLDPCRVTLHIITDSHMIFSLTDLYQQAINWVDPNLKLFRVTERSQVSSNTSPDRKLSDAKCSDIPAIAIMIFLRGTDQDGDYNDSPSGRIEDAEKLFQHLPWRFHHSEKLNQGNISTLPNNSQNFYYTSHDLPLWAIRHVHYGREHIRYVLYVSEVSWPDQVHFYRLILGLEPDLQRDDFYLFTVYTQDNYDVQFALKKIDSNLHILTLQNVHIHIKVQDIGHLVALFPNVCRPISELKWQTTDHDGNVIILDVSPANSTTKNNSSCYQSGLDSETDHQFIFTHRSESYRVVESCLASAQNVANPPSHVSELSFNSINSRHFAYTQQLESLALSDYDDFDLDLPSPLFRHISKPDEDQESLSLTNTSEESGIQMQHGSEDLSFCEEEGLRSCLSKNSSLKIRHVKFKVRFKEEVDTFEDSFSRISSGIESEDQSDVEMETRFPYLPSSVENPSNCEEHSAKSPLLSVTSSDRISFVPLSETSSGKGCNHFTASSSCVDGRVPQDIAQRHNFQRYPASVRNEDINDCVCSHGQIRHNNTEREAASTTSVTEHNCHQNHRPSHQVLTSTHHPSSNLSLKTSTQNVSGDVRNLCLSRPHLCPDSESPVCHCKQYSKNQYFTYIQSTASSNDNRNSSIFSLELANNQQTCFRPSSFMTSAKSKQDRQCENRTPSGVNISKMELPPSTPPAGDSRMALFSVESNLLENKTRSENCSKSDPFSELQHFQNGQKKFWFADSNLDLTLKGCSDQEDTTLKFTLKFDTCSTSGLSSQQEQIGFYV